MKKTKTPVKQPSAILPEKLSRSLYYGDNLDVLRKHISTESVDFCYIDPPFNSKRNYNQIYNAIGDETDKAQAQAFVDTWAWDDIALEGLEEIRTNTGNRFPEKLIDLIEGLYKVLHGSSLMAYLIHISLRVVEIHRVLKKTGSFYLHCDPTASHYLKLICDAVFCSQGGDFKNEIIWRRTGAHNKLLRWGPIHDVIFFYTKSENFVWNNPKRPYMKGHVDEYFVKDGKGWKTNYYGNVLTGSGLRGGESGKPWRGFDPTAKGRHWAIPGTLVEDFGDEDFSGMSQHQKLDRLYELGAIIIVEGEAWPIYERYLNRNDGQRISDVWAFQPYTSGTVFGTDKGIDEDVRWLGPKDQERLGYPTQKPLGLLERIIEAHTKKSDVILDAYCGCGTTVAAAENLERSWIGIDITYQSIALIIKRFKDAFGKTIADAISLSGIPQDMKSAEALAHKKEDKLRKEFEKWAALTYSDNQAIIHEKKGADGGIDAIIKFVEDAKRIGTVIISVKSGHVNVESIRNLWATVEREKVAIGVLLTLEEPTKPMIQEAKEAGVYKHPLMGRNFDRLQIVKVKEIVENKVRFNLPMGLSALKSAKKAEKEKQEELL